MLTSFNWWSRRWAGAGVWAAGAAEGAGVWAAGAGAASSSSLSSSLSLI